MNKVILIGRLTKDPDLKFAQGTGKAITRFTLAVNRLMKKDEADFINCIAFGKTGETIAQYLTKGKQLAITGNIRTGSYEAKDGTKKYTTDVIIDSFEFISGGQANQTNPEINNSVDEFDDMIQDDGDIPF